MYLGVLIMSLAEGNMGWGCVGKRVKGETWQSEEEIRKEGWDESSGRICGIELRKKVM